MFNLRERTRTNTKAGKEYCWAETQQSRRSCCDPSGYFLLYTYVVEHMYTQIGHTKLYLRRIIRNVTTV